MYHDMSVYVAIHHPFNLAFRDYCRDNGISCKNSEAVFQMRKNDIADEVWKHAHTPSYGSSKAVKMMAMRPWEVPRLTKDDGIMEMSVAEIKSICRKWLDANMKQGEQK